MNNCCTEWNAQCAVGSQNAIARLREPWERLANSGAMPGLQQQARYKVYTLRSQQFGGHISVVFSHEDRHFIAISLVIERSGVARAFPAAQILDSDIAAKLVFCAELTSSANQILALATQAMNQLGDYNWVTKNCQDYANKLLKGLGVKEVPVTDATKGTVGAGALAILVAIGSVLTTFFGKRG
eukprot:Seg43.3 transcript_id=Seg43.3/GoldUCD/mRNA.D3Y31 product="hypothetical protein" protein_id=Seg43.3/GoldUCD/D3Y31